MPRGRDAVALLALTAVAFGLRVFGLGEQILGGDELHLMRMVANHTPGELLGKVTNTDFSIPLALLGRIVSAVVPLSEWLLRMPVLVLGSLAPALLALGARRFVSPPVALLFGVVVALHPFFIFYSRFVRPYGPCMLIVLAVVVLLDAGHGKDRHRGRWVAALLAAIGGWIHLLTMIAAGLVFAGAWLREMYFGSRPAARSLLLAAVTSVLIMGLLFLPAAEGLRDRILRGNLGRGTIDAEVMMRNVQVLAGSVGGIAPAVLGALALVGAVHLALRRRSAAVLLLVPAIGLPLAVFVIRPHLVEFSMVLARYVFYALPLWLLFACIGLRTLVRSDRGALVAGVALAGLLLATGPYRSIYAAGVGYAHHNVYQTYQHLTDPRWSEAGPDDLPPAYRWPELGASIVEGPAPMGFVDNGLTFYQHVHRRPMRVMTTADAFWASDRFDLRHVVVLGDGPPEFGDATHALLHKDMVSELRRYQDVRAFGLGRAFYKPGPVAKLRAALQTACGLPVYEDDDVAIYAIPRG